MGDIFLELEKVKIHRIQQNGTAVSQITLDDDYNVPDYRPDIMKVLKENGELRFDEVKAANKAVWVKGSLVFHILYRCEQSDGKISCLKGEIPFQEKLNIDGLQENGEVHAAGEIEDLTVGVINSRKLSIRAVVVLRASAEEQVLEEFTSRLELPGKIAFLKYRLSRCRRNWRSSRITTGRSAFLCSNSPSRSMSACGGKKRWNF